MGPRRSSSIIESILILVVVASLLCVVCMLHVSAAEATARKEEVVGSSSSDGVGWIPIPVVCRRIFEYFPNCLGFLVGSPQYSTPSQRCCYYVGKLNMLAKQYRMGPRVICSCIELMLKGVKLSFISSRIQDLPHICHTTLSFPISDSMNCSMV